jgi:hypothetical protein
VAGFSSASSLQNFSGTRPVSYPISNGIISPGAKSPELEANHSSLYTGPGAYVENDCMFKRDSSPRG